MLIQDFSKMQPPYLLKALAFLFLLLNISSAATPAYSQGPQKPPAAQTSPPANQKPAQTVTTVAPKTASRNVQIYLKNGDDLKGQVVAYQPNKLFIRTTAGLRALNLSYYHGLILDTPEEQAFGNSVTHRPDVFEDVMAYTQKIRPLLNKQLENNLGTLPNVCKPTLYPMVHLQFDKTGRVVRSELLTRSNCPHLNLAMAQTVKQIKFPPLPKDYPINLYIFNYFFPVPSQQAASNTVPGQPPKSDNPITPLQKPAAKPEAKPIKK